VDDGFGEEEVDVEVGWELVPVEGVAVGLDSVCLAAQGAMGVQLAIRTRCWFCPGRNRIGQTIPITTTASIRTCDIFCETSLDGPALLISREARP
jgi:hypothetical protein